MGLPTHEQPLPRTTTHILLNGHAFRANCNQFECLARKTWCFDGIPEPVEMYFWLKTALDTLYNEAECLTSGANTPAPSDGPGAQGRRCYTSPGIGWLPNNPEAQASLLCWGKLPAAESGELFAWLLLLLLFRIFFYLPLNSSRSTTNKQATKSCIPFSGMVPRAYIFMYLGCFLRKPSRCRSMGVKGMHIFKVLETGCQIALQESRIISSFLKPGVRG